MLYLNLTDFSTASKRLNLNNVAEVERKESLFSLPKCSNVSKKTLRKSSAKKACFLCRNAATSRRKRCKVERRAELVRAMPRCSNVSKKHRTSNVRCRDRMGATTYIAQCGDKIYSCLASRRDATLRLLVYGHLQ